MKISRDNHIIDDSEILQKVIPLGHDLFPEPMFRLTQIHHHDFIIGRVLVGAQKELVADCRTAIVKFEFAYHCLRITALLQINKANLIGAR